MKQKRDYIVIILIVLMVGASFFTVYTASTKKMSGNVEQRAYDELDDSVKNHAAYISQSIDHKFDVLETLASYLGAKEEIKFAERTDLTDAVVLKNHLCMLGFSDINGDAVSYEGQDLGNISDREYFQKVMRWSKGENAVVYMSKTALVDEPRIIFSVPVVHQNSLVGLVFAAMELPDFNDMLVSDNFGGSEVIFVTDSSGTVIMKNENGDKHITGSNIFDDHFLKAEDISTTVENVTSTMQAGRSGHFSLSHKEKEYVAYTPLGINDWYVFSMVDASVINEKYSANQQRFQNTIQTFKIASAFSMFCVIALAVILLLRLRKESTFLQAQQKQYQALTKKALSSVIESMPGCVGSWIIQNDDVLLLEANDNYLSLLEISAKKALGQSVTLGFPELEKSKLLDSFHSAVMNKEPLELTTLVRRKNGEDYRVRIEAEFYDTLGGNSVYLVILSDNTELFAEPVEAMRSLPLPELPQVDAEMKPAGSGKKVFARTFGYFDLFVDGKPLHFTSSNGKELLAILIDRNGGTLTTEEAISLLWEDEPAGEKQMARYRRLAARLKETLQEAGIEDILISQHGVRSIDTSKVTCDYWEVLNGNEEYRATFQGTYMLNYTWAEETAAYLEQLLDKSK